MTIASNNAGKIREMVQILGVKVNSLYEAGIESDPDENGTTLAENALIKAKAAYEKLRTPVIADDTGLFIDALDGAPGVHSARFGEPGKLCEKVLSLMDGQSNRTAHFSTVICYYDGTAYYFEGCVDGYITNQKRGNGGFGYDPIFEVNNKTFAEMTDTEKNTISHRKKALLKLKEFIKLS
jgi:XTP/dITP diphosphohydrolase